MSVCENCRYCCNESPLSESVKSCVAFMEKDEPRLYTAAEVVELMRGWLTYHGMTAFACLLESKKEGLAAFIERR